ncbi:MAG: hypothetical protein M1829_000613 [Trizodia sp. TS-e1964]|nr:MAG: hypothetical protein M1829_000613 [Trizodia sp. TS-e1964]
MSFPGSRRNAVHHIDQNFEFDEEEKMEEEERKTPRDPEKRQLNRRRSQYYGELFASREPHHTPRHFVVNDSMIMIDIVTNVTLRDEYSFLTGLSYHFSIRYQRPESCIVVTGTCKPFIMAGSFAPAYVITVMALPSIVQPTMNKRITMMTQIFLLETLEVEMGRGIIRFVAIGEENLAINGTTVRGEIDALEKRLEEEEGGLRKTISRKISVGGALARKKAASSAESPSYVIPPMPKLEESHAVVEVQMPTMPYAEHGFTVPGAPNQFSGASSPVAGWRHPSRGSPTPHAFTFPAVRKAEPPKKVSRRKSFLSMFGK